MLETEPRVSHQAECLFTETLSGGLVKVRERSRSTKLAMQASQKQDKCGWEKLKYLFSFGTAGHPSALEQSPE